MKKTLKWIGYVLVAALVVIQFIRPGHDNPASDPSMSIWADATVPAAVQTILKNSCGDCHSNQTAWPWYSHIAPASWLVAGDVQEGREHMNLSHWKEWTDKKRAKKRVEIGEETRDGEMPLGIYTLLHPDAGLSPEQIATLTAWSGGAPGSAESEEHKE